MEAPVNEFTQNGIRYIAADANNDGPSCRGCAFDNLACLTNGVPPCDSETRGDKEIIWQQSPNLEMKNND